MNRSILPPALALLAACGLAACSSDKNTKAAEKPAPAAPVAEAAPLKYETSVTGTVTAQVTAIDQANRHITLRGPSGYSETYIVGPQVQRLSEIGVGDNVNISYTAMLTGELRAPTAQETSEPISAFNISSRTGGATPSGGEGVGVKVVTTVDAIDQSRMIVALKGPLGNRLLVRAKKLENLQKLHIGDTVIVTYTEGVALSVQKAN